MTIYKFLVGKINFIPNRRFLFLLAGFVLTVSAFCPQLIAQTTNNKDWAGTYTFNDMAQTARRRNIYEMAPVVEYNITVTEKGGGLSATLEINGMQRFEVYECSVKAGDDRLNLYFLSNGPLDGGQNNTQNFKKGALLFNLTKNQIGKKTKYLFQPAAFLIERISPGKRKEAVYFKKM